MFRALFQKEWRQLAIIRWGGIAIGVMLPLAFIAGAEMAKRGLLPTGSIEKYSAGDLMFVLVPRSLALGLWPLVALMAAVQSLTGDRASGHESFLLERPVPRGTIWRARLAASLASLAIVSAATAAVGVGMAARVGVPADGWTRWIQSAAGGSVLAALAFLGGMLASSLLAAPLGAVLGGVILGALPVLFGAQLGGAFPHARILAIPIGTIIPALMLPAYVAASWSAFCRGEPSGRGRVVRGLAIAGAALPVVLVIFAVVAPITVRASAAGGLHGVAASPTGTTAFVSGGDDGWGGGGWLVDVASGSKETFLGPPIQATAWSPDGTRVAVVTWSSALGGQKRQARIEIVLAKSGAIERTIEIPAEEFIWGLVWAPGGIVAAVPRGDRNKRSVAIRILDPDIGTWSSTVFERDGWGTLTSVRDDGRVLLRVPVLEPGSDRKTGRGYLLLPIDPHEAKVGNPMFATDGRTLCFAGWSAGLSPDGRFATLRPDEDDAPARVVELATGRLVGTLSNPAAARWLSGNRLAWSDQLEGRTRLFVLTPEGAIRPMREWRDARVTIEPSPDGRALLVSTIAQPAEAPEHTSTDLALFALDAPTGAAPEAGLLLDGERWVSISSVAGGGRMLATQWAGPRTLARIAPNVVYFEDLDALGTKRFVLGSEADLR